MSKKSGFFYLMLAAVYGLFTPTYQGRSTSQYQPEEKVHRSGGGREITSYGTKPVYSRLKRKKFYQEKIDAKRRKHVSMCQAYARVGIIWHEGKLYWKDRAYAEANKGVRTDMIMV